MSCAAPSRFRSVQGLACAYLAVVIGCAAPLKTNFVAGSRRIESEQLRDQADASDESNLPPTGLRLATQTQPATEEEALAGVLDQLQQIGADDPEAQQQLMDQLKQSKPEHYGLAVQQFRAATAYRRQLAERDAVPISDEENSFVGAPGGESEIASDGNAEQTSVAALLRRQQAAMQTAAYGDALGDTTPAQARFDMRGLDATGMAPSTHKAPPPLQDRIASDRAPDRAPSNDPIGPTSPSPDPASRTAPSHWPAPPQTTASRTEHDASVDHVLHQPSTNAQLTPASYEEAPPPGSTDWRRRLDAAIGEMAASIRPVPRSTDEMHDQMRLRALEMLAGRSEQAYRPIPGVAPGPQDFWSKQLFAMSTYLDLDANSDDKQRAAAALVHLDEARDQLAELATLQLRNAAFVQTVDGYGVYETLSDAKFHPNDLVTVYAEVENFRSESSRDGYRARLATSYQVLDDAGRRVDGGQFQEVEDVCQSRRRDFHLQYAIPLPERIYPGRYQLELVITDQLSNKIGQQSIPFDIVE